MGHLDHRILTTIAFVVVMAAALAALVALGDFRPAPAAFIALAAAISTSRRGRRC